MCPNQGKMLRRRDEEIVTIQYVKALCEVIHISNRETFIAEHHNN